MGLPWLPWRFVVRRMARRHGFLDPLELLARLQRFARPSEVAVPLELLRAGAVLHARGLVNAAVLQHNLDWVWPFWVERQFDPGDDAFLPRAFSLTHVNLTNRNWTAVGLPDHDHLPLVDPRGLVTPWWDGWSLDAWVIADDGRELLPSRALQAVQRLEVQDGVAVATATAAVGLELTCRVEVVESALGPTCRQELTATARTAARLVVSLRPANPEGVSAIHAIALDATRRRWSVDGRPSVILGEPAEQHFVSTFHDGDVLGCLRHPEAAPTEPRDEVSCDIGLATAAATYRIEPGRQRTLVVEVPLDRDPEPAPDAHDRGERPGWTAALAGVAVLEVPDERIVALHDAALRTLVLLSPGDVYPGPFTYRRFWFRDAAFLVHGLLAAGLVDRARRAIERFPSRQRGDGYFLSQDGEWDSNGAALWTYLRFVELSGEALPEDCAASVVPGARWIARKRLSDEIGDWHAGLLPAGFSAEHLGPNDFYYWDDFWSAAGLRAAAFLVARPGGDAGDAAAGDPHARAFADEADRLLLAVDRSLERSAARRRRAGIPASPHRRMDAGAIGSLAAGYPLQLWEPRDPRLLATVDYLVSHCFHQGAFFQDMIHSGMNAYLTLHCAQVLQRAGNPRAHDLLQAVARLASPTGQWPEAIHPRTGGGCMGDGQHGWAAAEWILAVRNAFVREEGDFLVLGEGLPQRWLETDRPLRYGPTPTRFGDVTCEVEPATSGPVVRWEGRWRGRAPRVAIAIPSRARREVDGEVREVRLDEGVSK